MMHWKIIVAVNMQLSALFVYCHILRIRKESCSKHSGLFERFLVKNELYSKKLQLK